MYYSNYNLLCDMIKMKLIMPKIYSISITNKNIHKYIKYFNKLVKNINKALSLGIKDLSLESIVYNDSSIIVRNIPSSINIKQCYYTDYLNFDDANKVYKYVNGIDCILYHKINKCSESILFLIYQNNGKNLKLKTGFNIWNCLSMINYSIYSKLNNILSKRPDIEYIRCILSHRSDLDMEKIYLNIRKCIIMEGEFDIYVLYYKTTNKEYFIDDSLGFKSLETLSKNNICNEMLVIDNKYNIYLYRQFIQISNIENINVIYSDIYNSKININFDCVDIVLDDLYTLSYYDIKNSNIYIYKDNNSRLKFYSDNININNKISLKNSFSYNFKVYNTKSNFVKICITNNIYNSILERHLINANIDLKNEEIKSSFYKIKMYNNINLFVILSNLYNKSIDEHLAILDIENDKLYRKDHKYLFKLLSYTYNKLFQIIEC
jgi:hypothetical protein